MLCQGPTCLLWCMHVPDSSNLFVLLQHLWRRQGGAAADLQPERGSHPAQVGDCCQTAAARLLIVLLCALKLPGSLFSSSWLYSSGKPGTTESLAWEQVYAQSKYPLAHSCSARAVAPSRRPFALRRLAPTTAVTPGPCGRAQPPAQKCPPAGRCHPWSTLPVQSAEWELESALPDSAGTAALIDCLPSNLPAV